MTSMVRLMASRVITQLISDLSGEEIGDGQGESVQFGYRGTNYTIDLTADEAAAFDEAIATYIENATQQGRARTTRKSAGRSQTGDAKAIREWAQGQGIDVPARGRIPAELREQYEAAN
ncbi:histone-like nucleoid-structuring protein Lsr2 [Nocardioides marmoraquaticus]